MSKNWFLIKITLAFCEKRFLSVLLKDGKNFVGSKMFILFLAWFSASFWYSATLRMFLPGCGCALPRSAWAWFLTGWARWSSCSWSGCLPCSKTRRQDWFDRLFLCLEENSFYRVLNIFKIKIVLKSEFRASYQRV